MGRHAISGDNHLIQGYRLPAHVVTTQAWHCFKTIEASYGNYLGKWKVGKYRFSDHVEKVRHDAI